MKTDNEKKEELWKNCNNKQLKKMFEVCPEIIEELENHSRSTTSDLIDVYVLILPSYNMGWGYSSIEKNKRMVFTYWYRIDDDEIDMAQYDPCKDLAEAQIHAVHATMYRLRDRIIASRTIPCI